MKHWLMRTTILRAPDGEGGSGGGEGGGGSGGGDQFAEALKGTPFEGKSVPETFFKEGKLDIDGLLGAATRPDPLAGVELPEKFLKDGKANVADLVKSYKEVEQSQFKRREDIAAEVTARLEEERAKAAPAAPGDYKPPEPWKLGDGDKAREFKIDADDPMFKYFQGVAHKLKLPQAEFESAMKGYVESMVAAMPDWRAEAEKLGPNADKRLERVDGFLKGNLSTENYNWFSAMPATAGSIKAIEELMTLAGMPPVVGDSDNVPGDKLTKEELRKMMSDPRYTGEKGKIDPAFVNKVRQGWRRLAGTQAA